MSLMLQEIHEQPQAVQRLLDSQREPVREIAGRMRATNCRFGVIAARGTSDNAATYGKYALELVNGLPVALAAPSVFTIYDAELRLSDALVAGISQSGQAADVNACLEASRKQGALTVAITNEPNSDITRAAEFAILCSAGPEKSVAATKTYTTSLAALLLLAAEMADDSTLIRELEGVPGQIDAVLNGCTEAIEAAASRYRNMRDCIVLARGTNRATAFESALKLAETCYVRVEPFSSPDFLHGPIAVVDQGFPCLLFAPQGPSLGSMREIAVRLADRGADLMIVSNDAELLGLASTPIAVPVSCGDLVSPPVYIAVGQLFANYLAEAKGLDPDSPRGLSKVTITR